jgi:malate synthase
VQKGTEVFERSLEPDLIFTAPDGSTLSLPGRSLMLVRNVGHHMYTDSVLLADGTEIPETMLDCAVTALIATHDLRGTPKLHNSRTGSMYIVKPKLHGPEEVAFANELFARVEDLLALPRNCLKMGVMDEEQRQSGRLYSCRTEKGVFHQYRFSRSHRRRDAHLDGSGHNDPQERHAEYAVDQGV